MNVIRIRSIVLFVAASVICGRHSNATGETLVVVPPGLENVEGDDGFGSDPAPTLGFRVQLLYPASDFSGLPQGYDTMVSMTWRPNFVVTSPNTFTAELFDLQLSTTSAAPGTLDVMFAENVGEDVTTVYSGPITLETDGAGGEPQGPRPFDYLIEFQTPFVYDPAEGNLLVDVTVFQPIEGVPALDAQSTSQYQAAFAPNASGIAGELIQGSFVAQFAFIPEPSTLILATLGLALTLGSLRRR